MSHSSLALSSTSLLAAVPAPLGLATWANASVPGLKETPAATRGPGQEGEDKGQVQIRSTGGGLRPSVPI